MTVIFWTLKTYVSLLPPIYFHTEFVRLKKCCMQRKKQITNNETVSRNIQQTVYLLYQSDVVLYSDRSSRFFYSTDIDNQCLSTGICLLDKCCTSLGFSCWNTLDIHSCVLIVFKRQFPKTSSKTFFINIFFTDNVTLNINF
jgi:hypothetical protein